MPVFGPLIQVPMVAVFTGGAVALSARMTAMANARGALASTFAATGRARVNASIRSPAGFNLKGIIHTQVEVRAPAGKLLFARIAVNIHPIGETFVIKLVPEARLPLFSPFQNVYWPGSS